MQLVKVFYYGVANSLTPQPCRFLYILRTTLLFLTYHQGSMSIFLRFSFHFFSVQHPEFTSEVNQTSSDFVGSSSSFLCQVQCAWVEFTIWSSPCPKLASLKTDHSGDGSLYLKKKTWYIKNQYHLLSS